MSLIQSPSPISWTKWLIAALMALSVGVVVATSALSGGYFSFQSMRGSGSTDLEITVERPIPAGLRVRYAMAFARETGVIVANPNHEVRGDWKELSNDGASDSVFFAFSTEPELFGYRMKRNHYADILLVWYQRGERETFREVAFPGNSEPGPWKVVVPIVVP